MDDLKLPGATVHLGDCLDSLRAMAAAGQLVQMCVTSPPYFGLRDYGIPPTSWPAITYRTLGGEIHVPAMTCCLGLEETPEAFIGHMVEVFRAVRDVLADDGTCWINIGDSYARNPAKGGSGPGGKNIAYSDTYTGAQATRKVANARVRGGAAQQGAAEEIKEKDLIGIPWMLAFALRADGWYLRQDIIWHKPNPMPESVTDRCTKAHEYVFLLSKGPRYFYDAEAVKEPCSEDMQRRAAKGHTRGGRGKLDASRQDHSTLRGEHAKVIDVSGGRNRRSVWTIATRPYKGAHFAVFPPDLVEPCILAGSRPGDMVLDPFNGSGTTGQVAIEHGRRYVGLEINSEYLELTRGRLNGALAARAEAEAAIAEASAQMQLFDAA